MNDIHPQDEDLRALCNIAGVSVSVDMGGQQFRLEKRYRARRVGERVITEWLSYSATRADWERVITALVQHAEQDKAKQARAAA